MACDYGAEDSGGILGELIPQTATHEHEARYSNGP